MHAPPSSPIDPAIGHLAELAAESAEDQPGLLAVLARMADLRHRRGVRHRLAVIMSLALCAVVAGARSFTAIAERAADADEQTCACSGPGAGCRRNRRSGGPCSAWTLMSSMAWLAGGRSRPPGQDRYYPPAGRTTALWAGRTPPGFVFDVKAFRLLIQHPAPGTRHPAPGTRRAAARLARGAFPPARPRSGRSTPGTCQTISSPRRCAASAATWNPCGAQAT
jgi:hypothetical protein